MEKEDWDAVSSQVSAPVSTTVIAFDIAGAYIVDAAASASFEGFVAAARAFGFVTQETGKPNLTLTLAPELAVGDILNRVVAAVSSFEAVAAPLRIRAMVHYGVVFRTESAGELSYVGSAIRSTQSALRRAPPIGGFVATQDFATYAAKLKDLPFRLQAMSGAAAADGMSQIVFSGRTAAAAPAAGGRLQSADAAFVGFAKRRLAEDIGPFASALVDRAVRSSTAVEQLVPALSREIDDPAARKRFEDDMLRYISSQTR
ncbi:MAG: hypothetical protein U1A72_22715 [Sulfuritalea sp.]|nr:hypothetical protein [Sulfuritalea sp.]